MLTWNEDEIAVQFFSIEYFVYNVVIWLYLYLYFQNQFVSPASFAIIAEKGFCN